MMDGWTADEIYTSYLDISTTFLSAYELQFTPHGSRNYYQAEQLSHNLLQHSNSNTDAPESGTERLYFARPGEHGVGSL
jgi:hypothetical protein